MAELIENNTLVVILTGIGVAVVNAISTYLREGRKHDWDVQQAKDLAAKVERTASVVEAKLDQQTAELVASGEARTEAVLTAVAENTASTEDALATANHTKELAVRLVAAVIRNTDEKLDTKVDKKR